MRDLSTNEILMVDGGARRGEGSDRNASSSSSNKDQGEVWGGSLACSLFGAAVGGITKNGTIGLAAGTICGGLAGNLDHGSKDNRESNHRGGDYHGHAGGMDGSTTGFGR